MNDKEDTKLSGSSCTAHEHSFLYLQPDQSQPRLHPRDEVHWYPMYVSYRRELTVKKALDEKSIENFVPMEVVFERVGKRIVRREQPAIHNLIFVNTSMNILTGLKMFNADCAPMQYMVSRSHDADRPTTIITVEPDKMEQFMKAMEIRDEHNQREFRAYDDRLFGKEGRRIRFISGDFAGIEGTIKRINKNRSLIITLRHVGVLVIAIPRASDIEFLD